MKFVKLGSVCKLRNGYAFKSSAFVEIGVPIIRISNINDNLVTPEKAVRIAYEKILDNYKIIKGDILIAMSGATTGKFGIYNSDEIAYQNQRVGCFQILDDDLLNRTYLLQVLKVVKPIIEKKANGGAQPNISANAIEEIIIPLPSIEDQIRIAKILSKAETLITQRKESIVMLDDLLKSSFLEMFGDPVRNDNRWTKTNLDNVATQITDGEHTTPIRVDSGIKLLSARNVQNGFLDFNNNVDYIPISEYERIIKRCKPEKNDILMSCSGSVGRVSIIKTNEPLSLVRSVALIKLKKEIVNPYYLQSWMQSKYFQSEIKRGSKTSSQSNIFTGAIKKLPVQIPPIKLQNQFAILVEKVETIKKQYQKSSVELENVYGVLSQKAFKGELKIK